MKKLLFCVIALTALLSEASLFYVALAKTYDFVDSVTDSIWRALASFVLSLPYGLYVLPAAVIHYPTWPKLSTLPPFLLPFALFYWIVIIFLVRKATRSQNKRRFLIPTFVILAASAPLWFFCVAEITHS